MHGPLAALISLALVSSAGCYRSHRRGDDDRLDAGSRDATPSDGAPDGTRPDGSEGADGSTLDDVSPTPDVPDPCAPRIDRVHLSGEHAFSMDRTEVTQADYARFLRCTPDASCGGAGREPGPNGMFDPERTPDVPVHDMTICGAARYCAWAGGRFCRHETEMGPACEAVLAAVRDASGDIARADVCVLSAYADGVWGTMGTDRAQPVGSAIDCHASDGPYAALEDVIGNVWELVSTADGGRLAGGSFMAGPRWRVGCSTDHISLIAPGGESPDATYHEVAVGFRCCAD